MIQSAKQYTGYVNQWQSPTLIPFVLELLKKELKDLDDNKAHSVISRQNIPVYQSLYQYWLHDKDLDHNQQSLVKEIGGYLNQTIFGSSLIHKETSGISTENSFKL